MTATEILSIPTDLTIEKALSKVSKLSKSRNKVKIGALQVSKALLRNEAKLVVVGSDAKSDIKEIITTLAKQANVPVMNVDDIAELCGLTKTKLDGTKKSPKITCYCVVDYVKLTPEQQFLTNELSK